MTSTNQEYWDACLIRCWRQSAKIADAINMWESITKISFNDENIKASLLRTPRPGFPWLVSVRVFVAEHLPKINDRLWDQPQEKDVMLLKALKNSQYTTQKDSSAFIKEMRSEQKRTKKNHAAITFENNNYKKRNRSTDWNVVKASRNHTK